MLLDVIGDLLPSAVGVALGWTSGLIVVSALVLLAAGGHPDGKPSAVVS